MKHYKIQENLKCCLNCVNSRFEPIHKYELFCYVSKRKKNVNYIGICDDFKHFNWMKDESLSNTSNNSS
jgi:hypothetical protein